MEVSAATVSLAGALGSEHPLVARYRTELARIAIARGDGETARAEAMEAAQVTALHIKRSFGAMTGRQRTLLARQSQEVVGVLFSAPGGSAHEPTRRCSRTATRSWQHRRQPGRRTGARSRGRRRSWPR